MHQTALRMADAMGKLNNSIRHGEGNVYGFLGEMIFAKITGAEQDNTYDWDGVMPTGPGGESWGIQIAKKCKKYYIYFVFCHY